MSVPIIVGARAVPLAFPDPPLLNAVGVHEPWALRSVIVVRTDEGITGLDESYGQASHLALLDDTARRLHGTPVHDINGLRRIAEDVARSSVTGRAHFDARGVAETAARLVSAFEVALWDARARRDRLPVHALLGGRVRASVPLAGYLFAQPAGRPAGGTRRPAASRRSPRPRRDSRGGSRRSCASRARRCL
ncbi:hypothetical protein J7E25_02370 [Agromyces sp. ISL-38]|uniref:hypothetical protein n=1 Tax=Agromyces sp. ISL-38 TaxID=2819107 RepID=UPI001BE9429C|nr:hypothetical protein [Agromyces sp. ISL-38]